MEFGDMDQRWSRRRHPDFLVSGCVSATVGLSPCPHSKRVVHFSSGCLVAGTLHLLGMALPHRRQARSPCPRVYFAPWHSHPRRVTCKTTMALIAKQPNQWVQATPDYACCLFLSRWSGAPDPAR